MLGGGKGNSVFGIVRRLSTQPLRIHNVKLAEDVDKNLKEKVYKPKKHPGRTSLALVTLDDKFKAASEVVLKRYNANNSVARKNAIAFFRHLSDRKPPLEDVQLRQKAIELEKELVSSLQNNKVNLEKKQQDEMILNKLRKNTYHWQPIEYNEQIGILYLLARAAPDTAILTQILSEMKSRLPQFAPKAIMDFGSGIGTVLWAAHGVWGKDIKEYFAVDTCSEMNDIARLLTQNGREAQAPFLQGIFYRQFLPASHTLRYDLVVSAFSLMELPNRSSRLLTLDSLWRKTDRFLVVVENGTNAGYDLIMEARAHLIRNTSESGFDGTIKVFSPCPHEFRCPRLKDEIPCNFEVGYSPLFGTQFSSSHGGKMITRFSYVVLEKKKKTGQEEDDRQCGDRDWPRIVSEVLARPRHVICRTCNSDGRLKEVVITAAKHGKELYKCTRGSNWGDRLPVTMMNDDRGNNHEDDKKEEDVDRLEDETVESDKLH